MVQDAMIKLAQNYANKPAAEWPPLFYRILQNRIRDWQRQQMVRNKVMVWRNDKPSTEAHGNDWDPIANATDTAGTGPQDSVKNQAAMSELREAISQLPQRQREVFLLRAVEELSVAQAALSLEIGEGSIKTHYSRALAALRKKLGDHWP